MSWNLDNIQQSFAAAAVDPERWSDALRCISTETDSLGAILLPVTGNQIPNVPISDELAKAADIYFRDAWYLRDLRFNISIPNFVKSGLIDDFDCLPAEEIKNSPYYQEFLAPAGLRWFAGISMHAGNELWCVSVNRKINQDPFSPEEKNKLVRVSRAISTSAVLAQALGFASANATLEAFDVSGTAIVLLNRQAEVISKNRAAENLLREGSVCVTSRRLTVRDPSAMSALGRALRSLLWSSMECSLMPAVPLPREAGPPILAYPMKLATLSANPFGAAKAAVILVDPAAHRATPEVNLRRAFQLTSAEARLAAQLATGDALDVVCEKIGISKETGRNQLKGIFSKTGVNRQAELALLLSRML